MIGNYIYLLDFFGMFLCMMLYTNVMLNSKNNDGYNKKNPLNKLIITDFLIGFISIIINLLIIHEKYGKLLEVIYFLFIFVVLLEMNFIAKFLVEINNLDPNICILAKKFFNCLLILFVFLSFIFSANGITLAVDFRTDITLLDVLNLVYIYAFILFTVCFSIIIYKRHSIMKSILKNIITVFPMTGIIIVVDFSLRLRNDSYSWSIVCSALSFILCSMFMVYYFKPYDRKFGTMGQEAFDEFIEEVIIKKKISVVIKFIVENKNELVLEYGTDKYEQYLVDILLFFDKYEFNIYKIRDEIYITYLGEIDSSFTQKLLDDVVEYMESGSLKLTYKLLVVEVNNNISSYFDFYNLLSLALNKAEYNKLYVCNNDDYKLLIQENIIKSELLAIVKNNDLDDDKIVVTAQPIYDIKTGTFKTAEALVRFKTDKLGLIYPDQFIYLAEEMKIIHNITLIVLNKVCKEIKRLLENDVKFLGITVNISAEEFLRDSFVSDIINIISSNGIPYNYIKLEFTESLFSQDYDQVKNKMEQLIDYGITFYLDDFGTGYSNFDKIISLPLSTIKFDKSLVWGAMEDNKKYYVVKELTGVFIKSGFLVLYEGIENDLFENLAVDLNVNSLQGYKYSKPIELEKIGMFFEK